MLATETITAFLATTDGARCRKFYEAVFARDYAPGRLKMNARPENPDEDHCGGASSDDPGKATFQFGWFC